MCASTGYRLHEVRNPVLNGYTYPPTWSFSKTRGLRSFFSLSITITIEKAGNKLPSSRPAAPSSAAMPPPPPPARAPRALLLLALLALVLAPAARAQVVDSNDSPDNRPAANANAAKMADTAAVFARADADHNGQLDAREFAAFTDAIKQALDPLLGGAYNAPAPGYDALGGPLGTRGKLRGAAAGVNKFWSGFVSGILTIWATEIGDKTFFIAAILSMKKDRVVVFAGAIGALIVMTVLSVVMGVVATKFLPPSLTHYIGAILVRSFPGSGVLCEVTERC